jgi:hypothetical protein
VVAQPPFQPFFGTGGLGGAIKPDPAFAPPCARGCGTRLVEDHWDVSVSADQPRFEAGRDDDRAGTITPVDVESV